MKKYPKVRHCHREEVLWSWFEKGEQIVIQEKIDGSNFRIGIGRDAELEFGSRKKDAEEEGYSKKNYTKITTYMEERMQDVGVQARLETILDNMEVDRILVFGEYLGKPRQATLYYENIPKNHLAVFDIALVKGYEFTMLHPECDLFKDIVSTLDVDQVPTIYDGKSNMTKQEIFAKAKEEVKVESYLGKQLREGIVFKNYDCYHDGEYFQSLMEETELPIVKFVREEFKEALSGARDKDKSSKNQMNDVKGILDYIMVSYVTKGRVNKAIMRLEEEHGRGKIDIKFTGKVIGEVFQDILAEEEAEINKLLKKAFTSKMKKYADLVVELFNQIREEEILSS